MEPVAPAELLAEIVEDAQRAHKPVTLGDIEGDSSLTAPMRAMAMKRAVTNLVENATRYGNQAEVSLRISEKSLRIRIEDDGPGIPAEQREDALKPFARLDAARNQNLGGGVGLGLAIANDTARAHGGVLRLSQSAKLGGLCADIVIGF
jgi:two-component system osmolarity sensor histidine kinase EnvZ